MSLRIPLSVVTIVLAVLAGNVRADVNACGTQIGGFGVYHNGDQIGHVQVLDRAHDIEMTGSVQGDPVTYRFDGCIAENLAVFRREPGSTGPDQITLAHDKSGNDDMVLYFHDTDGREDHFNLLNDAS